MTETDPPPPIISVPTPRVPDDVTEADITGVKGLKSTYANRLYVTTDSGNIRLNFAELVMGEPIYHTAITLSLFDGLAFGQLISRISGEALQQRYAQDDKSGE